MRQRILVDPREVEKNDKMWEYYEALSRKEGQARIVDYAIRITKIQEEKKKLDEQERGIKDKMFGEIQKSNEMLAKSGILEKKGEFNWLIRLNQENLGDFYGMLEKAGIAKIEIEMWKNFMPRKDDNYSQEKVVSMLESMGVDTNKLYAISNYRISSAIRRLVAKNVKGIAELMKEIEESVVIRITGSKKE
ncbi:MAG: hypothetical protein ACP5RM_03370 [Candidatus Micrarchaeia archaeon]